MGVELDDNTTFSAVDIGLEQFDAAALNYKFEGYVDFFGYHPTARGWLIGGWIAHPWPLGNRPETAIAHFSEATVTEHELSIFYFRADVERRGIGYVFFLPAASPAGGQLLALEIRFTQATHRVHPTKNVLLLDEKALTKEVQPILVAGEKDSQRRRLLDRLSQGERIEPITGFIEFYGYHAVAGGWLFTGWVSSGWPGPRRPENIAVSFERSDIGGEAAIATYERADLNDKAEGVSFLLRGSAASLGSLCSISFDLDGVRSTLHPSASVQRLREQDLIVRTRSLLLQGSQDPSCETLLGILSRRPYGGEDTLAALSDPVFFEVDEAIFCEPDGLLLMGWHLAKPGVVRAIRVRCGTLAVSLDFRDAILVDRPDVVATFTAKHGFDDVRCGFIAFLPHAATPGGRIYCEIETRRGEIGFRGLQPPKLEGIAAIRYLLDRLNVRFGAVPHAFDHVIGPAIERLNTSRLTTRPVVEAVEYGRVPANPRCSVVIPLYKRLDFVEYQLALFSEHAQNADVEFIYVLDEPVRRQEAEFLCVSVYERFRIPFRLLLLDRNVGFGPASNIGLAHAHGAYIAFLNSDVFPSTPDWLERLTAQLEANADLGVIGGLLLSEDGSVQHQGMQFVPLREFGGWLFPQHEGKGMRDSEGRELRRCFSITGACMVLRRALAERVGGFDEIYVIGDFEDSDLCLKLRALGYGCAVDPQARLFHLERKSQASPAATWRLNLTLYNAWQHQRRWAGVITAHNADAST